MSKITIDRALLERRLNALRDKYSDIIYDQSSAAAGDFELELHKIIEALAQPQQEPVAWMHEWEDGERIALLEIQDARLDDAPKSVRPLVYGDTAQPARKPLTAGDRDKVFDRADKRMQSNTNTSWRNAIVDEVEAAHGIKTL